MDYYGIDSSDEENHPKNAMIENNLYFCTRLFGEKSEQLKAICVCILTCYSGKISKWDQRHELACLMCVQFIDTYRLGNRVLFLFTRYPEPACRK